MARFAHVSRTVAYVNVSGLMPVANIDEKCCCASSLWSCKANPEMIAFHETIVCSSSLMWIFSASPIFPHLQYVSISAIPTNGFVSIPDLMILPSKKM